MVSPYQVSADYFGYEGLRQQESLGDLVAHRLKECRRIRLIGDPVKQPVVLLHDPVAKFMCEREVCRRLFGVGA